MTKNTWTDEKLAALEPDRLEILRQNAVRAQNEELAQRCLQLQQSRKVRTAGNPRRSIDPVVGFHFVCENDYEVVRISSKQFWSGVWAVDQSHCDPAITMNGYVALHSS